MFYLNKTELTFIFLYKQKGNYLIYKKTLIETLWFLFKNTKEKPLKQIKLKKYNKFMMPPSWFISKK